jgi:anti-sigma regulatory factor (Ser/Thr protein kinase)
VSAHASATFTPQHDAAHESRVLVRDFLNRQGASDLADDGELLISELVSNVVRHAHSPVEVDLHWEHDTLRADVRDGSSILPAVEDLAGADGGYGLRIVAAIARDWGVTQLEKGKEVWFTLGGDRMRGGAA